MLRAEPRNLIKGYHLLLGGSSTSLGTTRLRGFEITFRSAKSQLTLYYDAPSSFITPPTPMATIPEMVAKGGIGTKISPTPAMMTQVDVFMVLYRLMEVLMKEKRDSEDVTPPPPVLRLDGASGRSCRRHLRRPETRSSAPPLRAAPVGPSGCFCQSPRRTPPGRRRE